MSSLFPSLSSGKEAVVSSGSRSVPRFSSVPSVHPMQPSTNSIKSMATPRTNLGSSQAVSRIVSCSPSTEPPHILSGNHLASRSPCSNHRT